MAWTKTEDAWSYEGPALSVRVDAATGALDRLRVAGDPYAMNWVADADLGWHPRTNGWGLGVVGGRVSAGRADAQARWQTARVRADGDALIADYEVRGWQVRVVRAPAGPDLAERITLRNVLDAPREVGSLWLYTPFNVDTVEGAAGLGHRCHAHVWAGGRTAWIKAVRWSGEGPHVGLVATEGDFQGYGLDAVTEYAGSPVRGDICLVARDLLEPGTEPWTVAPGAELTFGWTVFAYGDDAEFAARLGEDPLRAGRYVLSPGESTEVTGAGLRRTFTATGPGVTTIAAGDPARPDALINLVTVPDLDDLLAARTAFIRTRQQAPGGALLPYHNGFEAMLVTSPRADFNDGRERVGMGVLLAQRRRTHPSPELVAATDAYAGFVAGRLQHPDGRVRDSSTDDHTRLYNYPWVARFWLEMYAATADEAHAERFLATVRAYYAAGGAEFYAIGVPVLRGHQLLGVRAAGLLGDYVRHAEVVMARGTDYPVSEVPFEQTIVGPAATQLLELALVTGDGRYRRAAEPHLRLLELFGGPQPDGRLHGVPVRNWDGYWFGARERWGDVMPHHWSAVSAWAWALRAAADDDAHWWDRADQLSRATLHTFTADGRASAAYVYPLIVNGNHEHAFDPLANDQDWALVTAQDIRDLRA